MLLAEAAGERVGLLAYSLNPNLFHAADGCLIEDLYVRPSWRGKGVARALVAHVMAEAPRRGWAEVSVSTGKDNVAALSLYRGQGLVEEYVLLEKHFPALSYSTRSSRAAAAIAASTGITGDFAFSATRSATSPAPTATSGASGMAPRMPGKMSAPRAA